TSGCEHGWAVGNALQQQCALPPRWAPSVLRAVGGWCRGCSSSAELGGPKPLKEWTLVVGPRGRLRVRVPCQVSVRPLDPQRYPGADRVLVTVSGVERSARRHLEHVRVRYDEALQLLAIAAEAMDSKAAVDVRTPGKFDLDIKTSGTGCVKVQKMECDNCKIETEKGTSVLQSIKSVNIEKLQGTSINISTEDGLLKTKYLYAESSSLSSVAGDILLGSIHGKTLAQAVQTSCGCFILGSAQGRVGWGFKQPDLLGGSITVKVPTSLKAYLELSGRKVDVSSEIELKETRSASKDDHVILSEWGSLRSDGWEMARKEQKLEHGIKDPWKGACGYWERSSNRFKIGFGNPKPH
uniref:Family with sequence similarity 185 member A n=1 Tax=Pavo cristatus TaxID=9049 RepID=A0A8C9EPP3_PAVCR